MVARSPMVSESARVLRVALIGGSAATGVWLLSVAVGGLPAFLLGVVAIGLGAITLALIINQTVDTTTDYRHRKRLIHRFSSTAVSQRAGIRRCDLCSRIQMQASDVWLCPHCDNPKLS